MGCSGIAGSRGRFGLALALVFGPGPGPGGGGAPGRGSSAVLFAFFEGRPDAAREDPSGKLDSDGRGEPLVKREQPGLDTPDVLGLVSKPVLESGGQRLGEPVGNEDAQERADQRRADLVTNLLDTGC